MKRSHQYIRESKRAATRVALGVCLAMALVGFGSVTAAHAAAARRAGGAMLHTRFSLLAPGRKVLALWASDGYVFVDGIQRGDGASSAAGSFVLDEKTGHTTVVAAPGDCQPAGMGGGWVLFNCGRDTISRPGKAQPLVALYSIAKRTWRAVPAAPFEPCGDYTCGIAAVAIGKHWIEYDNRCGDVHGCKAVNTYIFQSLASGQLRRDPRRGSTVANLDAPGLAVRACRSLSAPTLPAELASQGAPFGVGSLTVDGRFGIASGGTRRRSPTFIVERCGKRLRKHLSVASSTYAITGDYTPGGWCEAPLCGPAYNRKLIVWPTAPGAVSGVFLPKLEAFRMRVPTDSLLPLAELIATPTHVYVLTQNGDLWSGGIPAPPREFQ